MTYGNAQVRPITDDELAEFDALPPVQKYVDSWPRWQSKHWLVLDLPDPTRLELWNGRQARLYQRPPLFMLARFGARALDGLFARDPFEAWDDRMLVACLRVDSPRAAIVCARVLMRRRQWRKRAKAWLLAHAEASAIGLIPAAFGRVGRGRRMAERALRCLAAHEPNVVRDVAARYGAEASRAVEGFAFGDPLGRIDVRAHTPRFVRVETLPQLRTRDGSSLPREATENLVTILRSRGDDVPYAGIDELRATLDPRSLADIAWALFLGVGSPRAPPHARLDGPRGRRVSGRRHALAPRALPARLGAVGSARVHRARRRPRRNRNRRRVPRALGDGRRGARAHPRRIGERSARCARRARPRRRPRRARRGGAESRRPQGARGARRVARPDEIALEDGRRVAQVPRASKSDDSAKVAAAIARFNRLRRESRTIAKTALRRLERAMVSSRRFTVAELESRFVRHPILGQAARRLVWGVYEGEALASTFRVVEDGTYADADDSISSHPTRTSASPTRSISTKRRSRAGARSSPTTRSSNPSTNSAASSSPARSQKPPTSSSARKTPWSSPAPSSRRSRHTTGSAPRAPASPARGARSEARTRRRARS